MKIFRALVLGALLAMATPAVPQQPAPKPVVEYNIANCGSKFTIVHVVMNEDRTKLTFGQFLISPTELKTDIDPLVFDYAEEKPDEDGDVQFQGIAKLEGHKLELDGYTRGNRIIAVLMVDDKLG